MSPERRLGPRIRPEMLAYLNLGEKNGGIVADLSGGGLGFQVVSPAELGAELPFWFSLEAPHQIRGTGEVIWLDTTKKAGGLRFVEIAEEGRVQLRAWLAEQMETADAQGRLEPGPTMLEAALGLELHRPVKSEEADADPQFSAAREGRTPGSTVIPTMFPMSESAPEPAESDLAFGYAAPLRRWLSKTIGILLVLALGAGTWIFYTHQRRSSEMLARVENAVDPNAQPQVPPASPPSPSSPAVNQGTPGTTNTSPSLTPAETPPIQTSLGRGAATTARPREIASGRKGSDAAVPIASPGAAEFEEALRYLHGERGRRNSAAAVPLLWEAVKKGSIPAEVLLATLYARGDGVKKSCTQARVLLAVAAKKGNREAIERLPAVERGSCP